MISFNYWKNVELRVGLIEVVDEIEGKDNLYKLTVSFGEMEGLDERRTVVAGLKPFYPKDELMNIKAVFVYNLEPVKLAGIESNAMILAAKNENGEYKICIMDNSIKEGIRLE